MFPAAAKPPALSSKPVRVIIAGQARTLRARLRLHLDSRPGLFVTSEVSNHLEAIAAAVSQRPEVILVDADIERVRVIDHIPDLLPFAKHILVVTATYDKAEQVRLTDIGARDVVIEEMVRDAIIRYTDTDTDIGKIARLSDKESAVIKLVARGLNDKRIAGHLSISDSAVLDHLNSIYRKLNVDGRFELLIYSFWNGLADPVNP